MAKGLRRAIRPVAVVGLLLGALAGCDQPAATRSAAPAESTAVDGPVVAIGAEGVLAALDGNTLVLRDSGDRIYFSTSLRNFLRAVEGADIFRRLIGREVVAEGGFLALTPSIAGRDMLGGIGAVYSSSPDLVSYVLVQTFEGDDRIVDLHGRERLMMAVTVVGTGEHVACTITGWLPSTHRFSPEDFRDERCQIVAGRAVSGS